MTLRIGKSVTRLLELLSTIKNAPAIRAELAAERNALAAERDALATEKAKIAAMREALASERGAFVAERSTLVTERNAFAVERRALVGYCYDEPAEEGGAAGFSKKLVVVPPYFRSRSQYAENFEKRVGLNKSYAILGSSGRSATHWITAAFNLHEKVFFSHGPDLEPKKSGDNADERENNFLRIAEQMDSFDFADIDKYFDILEGSGEYAVYGNVHGLTPPTMEQVDSKFRRPYYSCAILRHPVPRIQSFVNRWRYECTVSEARRVMNSPEEFKKNRHEEYLDLIHNYGIVDLDEDAILFAIAVHTTFLWDGYCINGALRLFQMERLVSDLDYFLTLFHEATAGLVDVNDAYLTKLRALKPIERRSKDDTANQVFLSWAPWKQRYFRDALSKNNLADAYDLTGYSLRPILG